MPKIKPSNTSFADCHPEVQKLRERLVAQILAESGHLDFWATVPQKNLPVRIFNPVECNSDILEILLELVIVKRKFQRLETDVKEITDVGIVITMIILGLIILAGLTHPSGQFGTWLATLDRSSLPHWVSQLFNHKVMIGAIDVFKILVPLVALSFRLTASLMALTGTFMLGAVSLLFSSVAYLPGFAARSTMATLTGLLVLGVLGVAFLHLSPVTSPRQVSTPPGEDSKQLSSEGLNKAVGEKVEETTPAENNTSTTLSSKESSPREPTETSAEEK